MRKKFVSRVGEMPFTGKHAVRRYYTAGVRAARHGDVPERNFCVGRIGHYAITNTLMGVGGLAMSALTLYHGVKYGSVPQFVPEAVGTALYGVGHAASAAAEIIIRSRLLQVPVNPDPPDVPLAPLPPPPEATLWEKVVTNGGTIAACLPIAHITVHAAMTGNLTN